MIYTDETLEMAQIRCTACNEINDQNAVKCESCKSSLLDVDEFEIDYHSIEENELTNQGFKLENVDDGNVVIIPKTTIYGSNVVEKEGLNIKPSQMVNSITIEPRRMSEIAMPAADTSHKSIKFSKSKTRYDGGDADFKDKITLLESIDSLKSQNVISKKKAKRRRKRRIIFAWDHQTESALIAAVQKERSIWDSGRKDYKNLNAKLDTWKQVASELNIVGVNDQEARLKWQSLRSHFKARLGKFQARKSGQDASEIATVSWAHFSEMMFLESFEVSQPPASSSTIELDGAYNDASILTNPQSPHEEIKPKPKRVRQNEERTKIKTPAATPTPPSSPSLSSNSYSGSMRDLASQVLGNIAHRQDDRSAVFGQLVASHLRRLPEDVAFNLEGRIMQMIYSMPQSISSASSQVTRVDHGGGEITDRNNIQNLPQQIATANFHQTKARRVNLHPPLKTTASTSNAPQNTVSQRVLED